MFQAGQQKPHANVHRGERTENLGNRTLAAGSRVRRGMVRSEAEPASGLGRTGAGVSGERVCSVRGSPREVSVVEGTHWLHVESSLELADRPGGSFSDRSGTPSEGKRMRSFWGRQMEKEYCFCVHSDQL